MRLAVTSLAVAGLAAGCGGPKERGTRSPAPLVMYQEDVGAPLPSEPELELTLEMEPAEGEPAPDAVAEAAPAPAPERARPVRRPSEDVLVLALQRELAEAGHDPGAMDGALGARTERALRAFQEKEGLPATGMPDGPTLRALFETEQVVPVAGRDAPEAQRPATQPAAAPSGPGWPTWAVLLLVIALAIAIAVNAAQWSSARRVSRSRP